jgi:predicted NUDIX family phosphoesterase
LALIYYDVGKAGEGEETDRTKQQASYAFLETEKEIKLL